MKRIVPYPYYLSTLFIVSCFASCTSGSNPILLPCVCCRYTLSTETLYARCLLSSLICCLFLYAVFHLSLLCYCLYGLNYLCYDYTVSFYAPFVTSLLHTLTILSVYYLTTFIVVYIPCSSVG